MKKVVAILGGKKDGNTHNLLKYLETLLNHQEIEMDTIILSDMDIQDCRGCESCVLGEGCVIDDDMPTIEGKMKKADGIIIASPVYNNNVSGKTKMFIDKSVKWSHSPFLTSIPYIGLTTTSSSGLKFTLDYLTVVGVNWGAHPVGTIWASKRTTNMKKNKRVLSEFIKTMNQNPSKHRPSLKQIMMFQRKRVLAKTVFPNDYPYWNEQDWLDKPYYYKCKINPFKRIMGAFFHWMLLKILSNVISKSDSKFGDKDYGKLIFDK